MFCSNVQRPNVNETSNNWDKCVAGLQETTSPFQQVVNMHLILVGNKPLHGNHSTDFLQGKLTKLGET